MTKIGILIGSLREKAFSKSVAKYVASVLPDGYEPVFIEFNNLELFTQDLEETPTAAWVKFRDKVRPLDAVLFVTPEYNRSIPGGLKNALDVGSRPYGFSVWNGKPGGVISVSPGNIGGFGANHHLRQVLTFLNVYTMQQPEAYVAHIADAVDEAGNVVNEKTQAMLKGYVDAYIGWIENFI